MFNRLWKYIVDHNENVIYIVIIIAGIITAILHGLGVIS